MKKMFLNEETEKYYEELRKIGLMDKPEEEKKEEPKEEEKKTTKKASKKALDD